MRIILNYFILFYKISLMKNDAVKVALVTGASSGIGKATAKEFARGGYIVYGTSRYADYGSVDAGGAAITMLPMSLEDEGSIKKAVDYIIERHGRIDVLVNNAGIGTAGAIEETTAEEAFLQFNVSFLGILRVLNSVLPHMRKAGRGTVINIGSMSADYPVPYQGIYSAAKSAVLTMSAALRMEIKPFGVRVCVIEPGNTITNIAHTRYYAQKTACTEYGQPLKRSLCIINSERASYSPERCAKAVLRAARMKNPPLRMSVGLLYKLLHTLAKATPWRIRQRAIEAVYLKNDPPKDAVWTFDKQFKEK
jgi:short-subunit dehydrogenase